MKMLLTRWLHRHWQKKGWLARLLYPLSLVTARIVKRRQKQRLKPAPQTLPLIIVVGNILVGGAGKTPVVIALCQAFQKHGYHPGVISRGYGVKIGPEARAGRAPLSPHQVGDEPSLIAARTGVPISVHPDRRQALQALLTLAPETDIVIADDGLQHYGLPRDIEIVVQDERGVGNGWLLPAGPLREGPERLHTVDWVISHQKEKAPAPQITMRLAPTTIEHLATGTCYSLQEWLRTNKQPCQAFAAIGQPQRFFSMLTEMGVPLQETWALTDHAPLSAADVEKFHQGPVLTTAKDGVKLAHSPWHTDPRFWLVHVEAVFAPCDWLQKLMAQTKQFHVPDEHVKNKNE